MAPTNKLMIIVWKWRNANNIRRLREEKQDKDYDVLEVKGKPEHKLMRYDPPDAEASIPFLRTQIETYSPTHAIQIFLHIGNQYKQAFVKDRPIGGSVEPPIFFGSGGHLYLSPYSPCRLCGEQVNLEVVLNN